MHRPSNYNTKHGKAIFDYLESAGEVFVTVTQIEEHLKNEQIAISRPTVYRQLEKLIGEGKVRKFVFDGFGVSSFQYVDPDEHESDVYHLKCEVCDEVFPLKCDNVYHVSRHISQTHDFQVNDKKTVFYGKCKVCMQGL